MKHLLLRLRSTGLVTRFYQAANWAIIQTVGGPLKISHIAEYPKCGGSWVRNMLQTYQGGNIYLANRLLTPKTVISVHKTYSRTYCNPIVVVRDVRDMFVSAYYAETKQDSRPKHLAINKYFRSDPSRPLQVDFADYLRGKLLHVTQPSFFYCQFLDSWLNRPGVCIVRYEDCLMDAEAQLIRILRHLGIPVHLERVSESVKANSFERYTQNTYGKVRKPGESDPTKYARKGVAGDWKNHFNEEACRLVEKFEGHSLRRLNYEADAGWIDKYLEQQHEAPLVSK